MEELMEKVRAISDTYDGFEAAVLTYCGKKAARREKVLKFINENPSALSSDILSFIVGQSDFREDSVIFGERD